MSPDGLVRPALAYGTVGAVAVRVGLDRLTEIAGPLRIRVGLDRGELLLTTHGSGPWWATVAVPAGSDTVPTVSAWVPRLDFRQAVDAEALLVPEATCSITVVQDDVVRYGGFAFPAFHPPDPAPPPRGVTIAMVPTLSFVGGRHELPDGRVIGLAESSLERFRARSIETVELTERGSAPYVVGRDSVIDGTDVVLIAEGSWSRAGDV